jgi:hypothetical protein
VTTAGCTIKFRIVVEVSGKDALSDTLIETINKTLAQVSPRLQLR